MTVGRAVPGRGGDVTDTAGPPSGDDGRGAARIPAAAAADSVNSVDSVAAARSRERARGNALRAGGALLAAGLLVLAVIASLAVGSKAIPFGDVVRLLLHPDNSDAAHVIQELRVPRTLLGLGVGASLALAGALMQALTRNPLADPGILGVEAGAVIAIAAAIGLFGLHGLGEFVWFSFAGSAITAVVVYLIGSSGRTGATPVRLALAGTAVSAALAASTQAFVLTDPKAFEQYRYWGTGALSGHDLAVAVKVAPFMLAGLVIAMSLGKSLNAIALGDDMGQALGVRPGRTRALGVVAVTLLCGAATAAVGPIGFVGLVVAQAARLVVGQDNRWVLLYSLLLGPVLLLVADIVGRLVLWPAELEAGVVTAFIGMPVFLALVRRRRIAQL
ncbi:FecCD family ABC transporter permease [Streptosporangium carneum]|uniref:Iron ABC transporter permease n=1 Tax=Streptosporangium carneum TaxID=47481 RepID=A0A9W6I7A9_9ACTN|nr:iron chelate uptake ABC transporter family permease subunit [Streptosporangium carneum]GLK12711.1 iron ABC transporter permease [Streptosporangium carneum]